MASTLRKHAHLPLDHVLLENTEGGGSHQHLRMRISAYCGAWRDDQVPASSASCRSWSYVSLPGFFQQGLPYRCFFFSSLLFILCVCVWWWSNHPPPYPTIRTFSFAPNISEVTSWRHIHFQLIFIAFDIINVFLQPTSFSTFSEIASDHKVSLNGLP